MYASRVQQTIDPISRKIQNFQQSAGNLANDVHATKKVPKIRLQQSPTWPDYLVRDVGNADYCRRTIDESDEILSLTHNMDSTTESRISTNIESGSRKLGLGASQRQETLGTRGSAGGGFSVLTIRPVSGSAVNIQSLPMSRCPLIKEFRHRRCIIIGRSEPMPPKSGEQDPDPRSGSNPTLHCKARLEGLPTAEGSEQ